MSRIVCFIGDEGVATCSKENDDAIPYCEDCDYNPFPGKKVPSDRILREPISVIPFEYEPLTDEEYARMMKYRWMPRLEKWQKYRKPKRRKRKRHGWRNRVL